MYVERVEKYLLLTASPFIYREMEVSLVFGSAANEMYPFAIDFGKWVVEKKENQTYCFSVAP